MGAAPLAARLSALSLAVALASCSAPAPPPASTPSLPRYDGPPRPDLTELVPGTAVTYELAWIDNGGFWLGRHEVTWNEYLIYCAFDSEPIPADLDAAARPSRPLETHPYDRHWGTGRRPAVGMSRLAAERYCAWLSDLTGHRYRLPTEAEWRLAAGEPAGDVRDQAWTADDGGEGTRPVGTKAPGPHGLHDMLGNLWEYCAGGWSATEPGRAVMCGGSWRTAAADTSPDARLGFDTDWVLNDPNYPPGTWWVPDGDMLGFRLLRERDPGDD